jgi:integrase
VSLLPIAANSLAGQVLSRPLLSRNPVAVIRLPAPRTRKRRWWTVDDARRFLESTRAAGEPLYAAFVLILIFGLRKGEVLGLTWELVNLDAAELYVGEQVQRVGRELLCRRVKTETSEAPLPLPAMRSRSSASGWAARRVALRRCCTGIGKRPVTRRYFLYAVSKPATLG